MPNMEHSFQHSHYEQPFAHHQHQSLPHHPSQAYDTRQLPQYEQPQQLIMPNAHHKNETKPRLGKEEVEVLEQSFQKNPKPTTNTKKKFAEDMDVDLSRINNWFQNRRAKRKQERKQAAYEAGQIQEINAFSEGDSPDLFVPSAYYDNGLLDHVQVPQTSSAVLSGPPPSTASYNPQYSDPTGASLESLERTMAAAQAVSHQDLNNGFGQNQDSLSGFGGPLVLHGGPDADRAQFPSTSYELPRYAFSPLYEQRAANFSYAQMARPITGPLPNFAASPVANDTPTLYGGYPGSTESTTLSPHGMANFSSHLLADNESPESSEETFTPTFNYEAAGSSVRSSQSPPSSGSFRSPPPPMDIAARRKKVQHKPAALGMDVIRRPSLGPRTVSQAEDRLRRPVGSPAVCSPMRRIVSAGGSNTVMSGRVQKSGFRSAQRSPIDPKFFADAMERSFHSTQMPPSLTAGSSLNSSLAPPTPMSPHEMGMVASTASSSSPEDSMNNFLLNNAAGPHGYYNVDGEIDSPPETPSAQGWYNMPGGEWAKNNNIADEPLFTPANDEFPAQFQLEIPAYLTGSQPVTPAFGEFNPNLMFQHESPQYELSASGQAEYTFPGSQQYYPTGMLPGANSPPAKQKEFQFSNTTPADFSDR